MSLKNIKPRCAFRYNLNSGGFLFPVIMATVLFFSSCQDKIFERYKISSPVYLSYQDLRKAVKKTEPQALKNPGKIYFKDNYIFINEYFKGIHIIDNHDPAKPVTKAFIEIPGNVDIAVKENTLYADSYIDLVAIDISNMDAIKESYRIEDVFPYTVPPKEIELTDMIDQTKGVVVRWEIREIEKEVNKPEPYPPYPYPWYYYTEYDYAKMNLTNASTGSGSSSGSNGSAIGVGGSMARFAIRNNVLYVISGGYIKVVDITDVNHPVTVGNQTYLPGIETIFLKDDYMYIGANNGMTIFDITDNFNPKTTSTYTHITACDPVVVEGNYAYITLRTGQTCRNTITNQLDVVDVSNKAALKWVKSYPFESPHGLGIENNILFLCDGDDGLKIFDASNVLAISQHMIAHFKDIQATDVIPLNGLLFMIGEDGFYQYDYTNLTDVKLLSKITVSRRKS